MIDDKEPLTDARKEDIRLRFREYLERHGITQEQAAAQIGISGSTLSPVIKGSYGVSTGKKVDDTKHLRTMNNWMELDSRRRNIVSNKQFVEHSVAAEIIAVAEIVAESCGIGVVDGPARIGKSFTLESIAGSDRLGSPILFRIDQAHVRPLPLCRLICENLKLAPTYSFDRLFRLLIEHLKGTKRMLMFDEVERCTYKALEMLRDLHDQTGCPMLLCGKPAIYPRLCIRTIGDYHEVIDQFSNRIVIRRDLTCRTREHDGKPGEPLFSKDDIRALIKIAQLGISVEPGAVDWLQRRSCCLGLGGFGMIKILLFLAYRVALRMGAPAITVQHLDACEELCVGVEAVKDVRIKLANPDAMKIRKLA